MENGDKGQKIFHIYHKFYNVMSFKFKELNKIELKFMANDILKLDIEDIVKQKMLPLIINALFKLFINKNENNELFWNVIDNLSHVLTVRPAASEDIFHELNIYRIVINHELLHPVNNPETTTSSAIEKNGVMCICPEANIRKTHECYSCHKTVHKHCFIWQISSFICPDCMLFHLDPFFPVIHRLIPVSILKTDKIYKFYIEEQYYNQKNLMLSVRSLRIYSGVDNQKYNDFECSFPQKGVMRLNGTIIHTFKPDKPNVPRRKDSPINIPLVNLNKNTVKRGQNVLLFEVDPAYEYENSSLIFVAFVVETKKVN